MRYLRLFEGYQTESEVAEICAKYGIENWSINSEGLVDVDGDVRLSFKRLNKIPLKFGTVTGYFNCGDNQLTNLVGAPNTVGSFNCPRNKLTSLEGSPQTVGSLFCCDNNKLTSLESAPKSVGGNFWCVDNNIYSFEGLVNIKGNLECDGNPVYKIWKIISPDTTDEFVDEWDNEKMEFFNDLDIIRGDEISIERLNFFLVEFGLNPVESVKGYKNIY